MKCPGCGCDNLPGADSCENCGGSLSQVDVPQPADAVERSLMEELLDVSPNAYKAYVWLVHGRKTVGERIQRSFAYFERALDEVFSEIAALRIIDGLARASQQNHRSLGLCDLNGDRGQLLGERQIDQLGLAQQSAELAGGAGAHLPWLQGLRGHGALRGRAAARRRGPERR